MKLAMLFRLLVLAAFFASARSMLADERLAPFRLPSNLPDAIVLGGEIDGRAALNFRRALAERPNTKVLILHSNGGFVPMALIIAEEVHERGLETFVPPEAECLSACAFIFLAGVKRQADGGLGVHQMSQESPDSSWLQVILSDVIEHLDRYGISPPVLQRMLRTPSERMYYFTDAEKTAFGINSAAPVAQSAHGTAGLPNRAIAPDPSSRDFFFQIVEQEIPQEYDAFVDAISDTSDEAEFSIRRDSFLLALRRNYADALRSSSDNALSGYLGLRLQALEVIHSRSNWRACNRYMTKGRAWFDSPDPEYEFLAHKSQEALLRAIGDGLRSRTKNAPPSEAELLTLTRYFFFLGGTKEELEALKANDASYKELCTAGIRYYKAVLGMKYALGRRIRADRVVSLARS